MEKQQKNKKRPRGRPFQPGQSGNPRGRKKLPPDIVAARAMEIENFLRTVIEVRNLTLAEIKKFDVDKIPMGKRAIINAYISFDYRAIKDYEDRLCGRAREEIEINTGEGIKLAVEFVNLPNTDTR